MNPDMKEILSTLGSKRSWQYERAVSCMASSSGVKRDAESSGSCQFSATGACAYRLQGTGDVITVRSLDMLLNIVNKRLRYNIWTYVVVADVNVRMLYK